MALLPPVMVPVSAGNCALYGGSHSPVRFGAAHDGGESAGEDELNVSRRKWEAAAALSGAFTPPRATKNATPNTLASTPDGGLPPLVDDEEDENDCVATELLLHIDSPTADDRWTDSAPMRLPLRSSQAPTPRGQQGSGRPAVAAADVGHALSLAAMASMQPSFAKPQGHPLVHNNAHWQAAAQTQPQTLQRTPLQQEDVFRLFQQQQQQQQQQQAHNQQLQHKHLHQQQQQQQQQHQGRVHSGYAGVHVAGGFAQPPPQHQMAAQPLVNLQHMAPSARSGSSCGSYFSSRTPSPQDQPLVGAATPVGSHSTSPQLSAAAHAAPSGDEFSRESETCRDGRVTLLYAPPRGTSTRVSWRNKLWSNTALLQARFGAALPRFFRENYADRSPTSEPLLHNNYPAASRVYFQGRVSAQHCVCHHLIQVFEAFSVTAGQRPDPLGLQALWIAPSQASCKVYGYAKFAEPGMAAAAVVGLKGIIAGAAGGPAAGEPRAPADESVDVILRAAMHMVPPAVVSRLCDTGYGPWSAKALTAARVYHSFAVRYRRGAVTAAAGGGPPAEAVRAAMADFEHSLARTFGPGVVTAAFIDSVASRKTCPHFPAAAPPAEPILLEDISLANEQRPGHRAKAGLM
ncbi:hypothetical protein DIPPA_02304 [Diplonema papillatum]|nr:hypothetical protein DIPPA_02304 [Diplonema papillatum]